MIALNFCAERLSLTLARLDVPTPSVFDNTSTAGFTVTNKSSQIVYLKKTDNKYEKISSGSTSDIQTAYGTYYVQNDDTNTAKRYLTIKADKDNGNVSMTATTEKVELSVNVNFA